jgi:hypothetical protein
MADQIQTTYPNAQELGQVGQKARTSAPFDADRIKIGATGLAAGDSFKLDGSGDAVPLGADNEAAEVVGVLMYEASALNDESTGEIPDYAVGEFVPYCVEGYLYAKAGSTGVAKGDDVLLDISEHDWITTGAPVVGQNKKLSAVTAAADGELFVLKVGASYEDRIA